MSVQQQFDMFAKQTIISDRMIVGAKALDQEQYEYVSISTRVICGNTVGDGKCCFCGTGKCDVLVRSVRHEVQGQMMNVDGKLELQTFLDADTYVLQSGEKPVLTLKVWDGVQPNQYDRRVVYAILRLPKGENFNLPGAFADTMQTLYSLGYFDYFHEAGSEIRSKLVAVLNVTMHKNYVLWPRDALKWDAKIMTVTRHVRVEQVQTQMWFKRRKFLDQMIADGYNKYASRPMKRILGDKPCKLGQKKIEVQGQTISESLGGIFTSFVQTCGDAIGSLIRAMSAISDCMATAFDMVKNYWSQKYTEWSTWFSSLVANFNWTREMTLLAFKFVLALALITICSVSCTSMRTVYVIGQSVAKHLWGAQIDIPEEKPLFDEVEAQGVRELATGLAFLVSMVVGEGVSAKALSMAFNLTNSSKPFFQDLCDNASFAFDYCYFKITGDHSMFYRSLIVQLKEIQMELRDWDGLNPLWRSAIMVNPKLLKEIEGMSLRADALHDLCISSANVAPQVSVAVNAIQKELKERLTFARARDPEKGKRSTPTCLWLFGKPGQGKTTISQSISYAVYETIRAKKPEWNMDPYTPFQSWSKSKDSTYWDTYAGQFTYMISEMFAEKAVTKRGEEGAAFLSIVDDAPFPLNMATLEAKGTTYFQSKLVIVTTNFEDFANCGMTERDALLRRVVFPIEVEMKKKIDLTKAPTLSKLNKAWNLRRLKAYKCGGEDLVFPHSKDKSMTFKDLVRGIAKNIIKDHEKLAASQLATGVDWANLSLNSSSSSSSSSEEEPVPQQQQVKVEESNREKRNQKSRDRDEKRKAKYGGNGKGKEKLRPLPKIPNMPVKEKTVRVPPLVLESTENPAWNVGVNLELPTPSVCTLSTEVEKDGVEEVEGEVWPYLIATAVTGILMPSLASVVTTKLQQWAAQYDVEEIAKDFPTADEVSQIVDIDENYWMTYAKMLEADWCKMEPAPEHVEHPIRDIILNLPYFNVPILRRLVDVHSRYSLLTCDPKTMAVYKLRHKARLGGDAYHMRIDDHVLACVVIDARGPEVLTSENVFKTMYECRLAERGDNDPIFGFFSTRMAGVMAATAVFAGITALIWSIAQWCQDAEAESYSRDQLVKMKKPRTHNKVTQTPAERARSKEVVAQVDVTTKMQSFARAAKHNKSGYLINHEGKRLFHHMLVSGCSAFITSHAMLAIGDIVRVEIVDGSDKVVSVHHVTKTTFLENRDGVRVDFDARRMQSWGDLSKHLRSRDGLKITSPMARVTVRSTVKKMHVVTETMYIEGRGSEFQTCNLPVGYYDMEGQRQRIEVREYYRVIDCKGRGGDCGRAYVAFIRDSADIIGIHMAGLGNDSYVCPVYLEDCIEVSKLPMVVLDAAVGQYELNQIGMITLPGECKLNKVTFMPTKTVFTESVIHEAMEMDGRVTVAPAQLTYFTNEEGHRVDPREKGFMKFADRKQVMDYSLLDYYFENVRKVNKGFGKPRRTVRKLTIEEAIFGNERVEALNQTASVTCDFPEFSSRKDMWNKETGWIHPTIRKKVMELDSMTKKQDKHMMMHATVSTKDELRDLERVALGKTRLFMNCSLVWCIFLKMCLGDYYAELKTHMADVASSVGVNPFGFDWQRMYYYLNEIDGEFMAADCPGYDLGVLFDMTYGLWILYCDAFCVSTTSEFGIQLFFVARAAASGILMYQGNAYRSDRSVWSGGYETSFANTYWNRTMHKLCFIRFRPDHTWKFEKCVRGLYYGDDNVIKTRFDTVKWYNMLTLKEGFEKYFGMGYTTSSKTEVLTPFVKREEVEFLGRSFRLVFKEEKLVMIAAPLNWDSIYGMLSWIRKSADVSNEEQLTINIRTACMEASLYGEEKYGAFVEELLKWSRESLFPVYLYDYSYWKNRHINGYHTVEVDQIADERRVENEKFMMLQFAEAEGQCGIRKIMSSMTKNCTLPDGMDKGLISSWISVGKEISIVRGGCVSDDPYQPLEKLFVASIPYDGKDSSVDEQLRGLNVLSLEEDIKNKVLPPTEFVQHNQQASETILGREYRIATYTNTCAADFANELFPAQLLLTRAVPLHNIVRLYRFVRWNAIKLRILMKSLPQQYGFVSFYRTPYLANNSTMLAAFDPVVLSLNQQEATEVTLPWMYLNDWIDTDGGGPEVDMWYCKIASAGPETNYIDSTVATTFTFDVYASFEGLTMAGPQPNPLEVEAQMELPQHVQDTLHGVPMNRANVASAAALGISALSSASSLASWWMGSDDVERIVKATVGAVGDAPKSVPEDQTGVVMSSHGATTTATDKGGGNNLDLHPPTMMVNPSRFGDRNIRHTIRSLITRPQFVKYFVLTAAANLQSFIVNPVAWTLNSTYLDFGYLAYFAQYFRLWRGSLKLFVKYTTSSFVSARITQAVDWGDAALTATQMSGDIPSKVITVKGDHEECWEIPFFRTTPWVPTAPDEDDFMPKLTIWLESISAAGDRTPSVIGQVWICAGDDFMFKSYEGAAQDPLPVEGQCDVTARMKNAEPMPGFEKVVPIAWDLTVEEVLFRWSQRFVIEEGFTVRVNEPVVGTRFSNWDSLNWLFLWNTGSVRYKLRTAATSGEMSVVLISNDDSTVFENDAIDAGKAVTDVSVWPILDFCVPFIAPSEVDVNPSVASAVDPGRVYYAYLPVTNPTIVEEWVKAGTNFQLITPIPPPDRPYWAWNNPYG